MRYARSDVTSITIGGHTHTFDNAADPESDVLTIDCPECDPVLAVDKLFASSREDVPLTVAERKQQENLQLEIDRQRVADALADKEYIRRQRVQDAQPESKQPARKRAPRKAAAK